MSTPDINAHAQSCLRDLLQIRLQFERKLTTVSVIKRLEHERLTQEDYRQLLLNMRQQVIEGSRWISRCASSFDRGYADIRSEVISHSFDEHRDYEMLERDFVEAGGELVEIHNGLRNLGTEALHGFLMYRASQKNPIDMIGAMWIIEGLGNKMATEWSSKIKSALPNCKMATSFLDYHGENDEQHMNKLYQLLDRICRSTQDSDVICRTAKVVAKLYLVQLEEIDNVSFE